MGVWDNPDDIDFESLPNQFVLKVNWGWGQNIIVKDKSKLDIEETKDKLRNWLEPFSNHYYTNFEWKYKNIPPKIICEQFMKDDIFDYLTVYKIFCFSSKPYMFQVILNDRQEDEKVNYYDLNWNKLDIKQQFPNFDFNLKEPHNKNLMIELSEKLSEPFKPFVRIDFFEINNRLYLSEFVFYSDNGCEKFTPNDWDLKLGNLIKLPKEKKIEYDILDRDILIRQASLLEPLYLKYKQSESKSNFYLNKYYKLKNNLFSLFGFLNEDDYITIFILGIKIVIKKSSNM